MGYQIFISYRRSGGEALAYLINDKLTNLGYKTFYDIESLSSGKFNTRLLEVMDECRDVLVILPPNSLERCTNEDDWLRLEIRHAIKTKKNVIPIMMQGFEWPEDMPQEIIELKHYNGVMVSFDFFEGVLDRIIKYLSNDTSDNLHESDKKHVLFWADFDDAIIEKIINRLDLDEYFIEILSEPIEMLSKNLSEITAIVLIVTDVTKFSANVQVVNRINEVLVEYVRKGGKLICSHDVIYRRTKNNKLQDMYGCKIVNFLQTDVVHYQKTQECMDENFLEELPEKFDLHDAEICWGELSEDVDVYFETDKGIPLVFSREYGKGTCIYFNSGDFKERPPRSLLKPEKNFVNLLRALIVLQN